MFALNSIMKYKKVRKQLRKTYFYEVMILVYFLENYELSSQSLLFQTALKCCRVYEYNLIISKVEKPNILPKQFN